MLIGFLITRRMLIACKNRNSQMLRVQSQIIRAGQKFPRPFNGFLFKVISQRPVAEHLKKGAVRIVAHFVDIPGAYTLLHVRQPGAHGVLGPQQVWHQRVHAGSGEKHRRVVLRDQASARNQSMPFAFEKF